VAMPFYVAPEQMMKDRAEYARKGIARGRALVAVEYADGVVFIGENPSRMLYKTSEIYDRIGFAAVGKYNEFESLRVAGIRLADVKGYQYAREDVTAKSLANAYSQALGGIFMGDAKPFEVELLIAQVDGAGGGAARAVPHPVRRLDRGRAGRGGDRWRSGRADRGPAGPVGIGDRPGRRGAARA
jgi:proteasome alpha subunit